MIKENVADLRNLQQVLLAIYSFEEKMEGGSAFGFLTYHLQPMTMDKKMQLHIKSARVCAFF